MGILDTLKAATEDLVLDIKRPLYSTGIDVIDRMNQVLYIFEKEDGTIIKKRQGGLRAGSIFYSAGLSGSGKSTLAIQIAFNIMKKYEDSSTYIHDTEDSNSHERCCSLARLKWDDYKENWKDTRIFHDNVHKSTEDLNTLFQRIYSTKVKFFKDVMEQIRKEKDDYKKFQLYGKIPPTILIIDSLANLGPKALQDKNDKKDELRSNMQDAQTAKVNNGVFKDFINKLIEANIIIICINHIKTYIKIDPYANDSRPLKWLAKDETLPGGTTPIYNSDYLVKLEQMAQCTPDKEFCIKGFISRITSMKSRCQASGVKFPLVFDQGRGVLNHMTNFKILKDFERIKGGGKGGFFLESLPDTKFSMRDIEKLGRKDEEFALALKNEVKSLLDELLPSASIENVAKKKKAG